MCSAYLSILCELLTASYVHRQARLKSAVGHLHACDHCAGILPSRLLSFRWKVRSCNKNAFSDFGLKKPPAQFDGSVPDQAMTSFRDHRRGNMAVEYEIEDGL